MKFEKIIRGVKKVLDKIVNEQYPNYWHQTATRTPAQLPTKNETTSYAERILELADGKPIYKIIEIMYRNEIKNGAWAVDIGIWKSLWQKEVLNTIGALEKHEYLTLKKEGEPKKCDA